MVRCQGLKHFLAFSPAENLPAYQLFEGVAGISHVEVVRQVGSSSSYIIAGGWLGRSWFHCGSAAVADGRLAHTVFSFTA